jgi:hypothetical protein
MRSRPTPTKILKTLLFMEPDQPAQASRRDANLKTDTTKTEQDEYPRLNRQGRPLTQKELEMINAIDSAMKKCVTPEAFITYRWDQREFYKNYKVGDYWSDPFFTSTTMVEPFTGGHKPPTAVLEFLVPKGTHGIFLNVTGDPYFRPEAELLLDRRQTWRITSIRTPEDGQLRLRMEKVI